VIKYLFIFNQPPFANSQSLEAMELALALSTFEQQVSLLFMADGVLQLLNKQETNVIYHKDFSKVFTGLALFDIKQVYVERDALQAHKLGAEMLSISPAPLAADQIAGLITKHDVVLSF